MMQGNVSVYTLHVRAGLAGSCQYRIVLSESKNESVL